MFNWITSRLRNKIFIFVSSFILYLLVFAFLYINFSVSTEVRKEIIREIENTQSIYKKLEEKNFKELYFFSTSLSEDPSLRKILKTTDTKTVHDYIAYFKEKVGIDLIIVVDRQGNEVVSTDKKAGEKENLFSYAIIKDVLNSGEFSGDYWIRKSKLYQLVAVPFTKDDYIEGVILTGFNISDTLAKDLKKITQTEISFLLKEDVLATTYLKNKKTNEEVRNLKALKDLLQFYTQHKKEILTKVKSNSLKQANNVSRRNYILNVGILKNSYLSLFSPLMGYGGKIVGIYVIQKSLDDALMFLKKIQNLFILVGFITICLSLFSSFVIAKNITASLEILEKGMEKVGEGKLEQQVNIQLKDEIGRLAQSFNKMIVGLRHKEQLKKYVSKSTWQDVEETKDGKIYFGGKHLEVTVLFSDIRSFTTMSEKIDPEEVIELLNSYLNLMNNVILQYGGDIDKFMGDAIMAVFYNDEQDSAKKAVLAAFAMKKELHNFNKDRLTQGKKEIVIGIGINTGIVIEGNVGTKERLEHTVLGDTVNLASRLEDLTKNSKHIGIMISNSTYERVKNIVDADFFDAVIVKGKTKAVEVYDLKKIVL